MFQFKKLFSRFSNVLENLIAPNKPRNNEAKLAISIMKPFIKPLKNPKLRIRAIIVSTIFTFTNLLYFL